jgi:prepilin-type N-terminal cleavage/methylation domain-containing protein
MNNFAPHKRATHDHHGFTLIETIGVLSIIAILASLLLPRIFTAMDESRVSTAALAYNSAKSATMTYFGKYGRLGDHNGASVDIATQTNIAQAWDRQVLLRAGFLEGAFQTKISTTSALALANTVSSATAPTASNSAYDLSGLNHSGNDAAGGRYVLEAVLNGVTLADARALNLRIDGTDASVGESSAGNDTWGRVKYSIPTTGTGTVRIYVAHR